MMPATSGVVYNVSRGHLLNKELPTANSRSNKPFEEEKETHMRDVLGTLDYIQPTLQHKRYVRVAQFSRHRHN